MLRSAVPSRRETESAIRDILETLQLAESLDPKAVLGRLAHLERALAPEHEFSLILSWLGRCRLIHRLGQEQLPLTSEETYRVPDLLATFAWDGRLLPVLVEVKTTAPRNPQTFFSKALSLKPHYIRYAELLGLPMLVAWRHGDIWTLFDARRAQKGTTNHRITFEAAFKANLLGVLAGDFSYRLMPGTAIRMSIRKLSVPDPETRGFKGVVDDVHFRNAAGEQVPNIPHLHSLFLVWENEAVIEETETHVVQSFVVPEVLEMEFASRTLSRLVHALADTSRNEVNWRSVVHDAGHLAHDVGRLHSIVDEGAKYGLFSRIFNQLPDEMPDFLQRPAVSPNPRPTADGNRILRGSRR